LREQEVEECLRWEEPGQEEDFRVEEKCTIGNKERLAEEDANSNDKSLVQDNEKDEDGSDREVKKVQQCAEEEWKEQEEECTIGKGESHNSSEEREGETDKDVGREEKHLTREESKEDDVKDNEFANAEERNIEEFFWEEEKCSIKEDESEKVDFKSGEKCSIWEEEIVFWIDMEEVQEKEDGFWNEEYWLWEENW